MNGAYYECQSHNNDPRIFCLITRLFYSKWNLGSQLPIGEFRNWSALVWLGLLNLMIVLTRARFPLYLMLIRIRGAMIDELRRQDWVPRSVKKVRDRQNIQNWLKKKGKVYRSRWRVNLMSASSSPKAEAGSNHVLCLYGKCVGGSENFIKDQLHSLLNSPKESLKK